MSVSIKYVYFEEKIYIKGSRASRETIFGLIFNAIRHSSVCSKCYNDASNVAPLALIICTLYVARVSARRYIRNHVGYVYIYIWNGLLQDRI